MLILRLKGLNNKLCYKRGSTSHILHFPAAKSKLYSDCSHGMSQSQVSFKLNLLGSLMKPLIQNMFVVFN